MNNILLSVYLLRVWEFFHLLTYALLFCVELNVFLTYFMHLLTWKILS